jgi:predicted HAD superfamily Cof-like phosphohydrolase
MSKDWVRDIKEMHAHYNVNNAVDRLNGPQLLEFLKFRIKFLREELKELEDASSPDDAIDALIDLCVVAIGTLDAFDVDSYTAWDEVHGANMKKEVGIKESRPNPSGLPDLIKPKSWVAPSHLSNRSLLDFVYLEMWSNTKPEK